MIAVKASFFISSISAEYQVVHLSLTSYQKGWNSCKPHVKHSQRGVTSKQLLCQHLRQGQPLGHTILDFRTLKISWAGTKALPYQWGLMYWGKGWKGEVVFYNGVSHFGDLRNLIDTYLFWPWCLCSVRANYGSIYLFLSCCSMHACLIVDFWVYGEYTWSVFF